MREAQVGDFHDGVAALLMKTYHRETRKPQNGLHLRELLRGFNVGICGRVRIEAVLDRKSVRGILLELLR